MKNSDDFSREITRHLDVVLLDEAEAFAEASEMFLKRFFHRVYLVEDCDKLMELLEKGVHAVILEQEFPFCDLTATVEKIRESGTGVPVFLMGVGSMEKKRKIRVDGYVHKPIVKSQLLHSVAETVSRKIRESGYRCDACLFGGPSMTVSDCRFRGTAEGLPSGSCPFSAVSPA